MFQFVSITAYRLLHPIVTYIYWEDKFKKVKKMIKNKGMNKFSNVLWNMIIILCVASLATAATAATSSTTSASSSSQTNTQPTSMAVDFTQTVVDTQLSPGDSGVLNLIIKNVGGMPAESVDVYLPTVGAVHIDKKQYIGHMDAGESTMIPAIIRIDDSATAGLNIIQVQITYDGFDPDGDRTNGEVANWNIPIRVYANPAFQISPETTTYYKDNIADLVLDGTVKDGVKGLEVKMTSNCVTVIGSSQAYVGDVPDHGSFKVTYSIKPTAVGACTSSLALTYTDQAGGRTTGNSSFGLNVQDGGVDYKLTDISYNPTGPGQTVNVSITLENIGGSDAQDTTVTLEAGDPFAPMDTLEKYIGTVGGGKKATVIFPLSIGFGAATQTYTMPLNISYKIGGTTYSTEKTIGIDVSGSVILSIISVDTSTGTARIDVANLGTRDASAVKATLIIPNAAGNFTGQQGGARQGTQNGSATGAPLDGQTRNFSRQGGFNATTDAGNSQNYVVYKSDIKAGKDSTFAFSASGSGQATLLIEYSGENNQRITQRETITLGSRSSTINGRTGTASRGTDYTQMALYAVVALAAIYIIYRLYKRRKKK